MVFLNFLLATYEAAIESCETGRFPKINKKAYEAFNSRLIFDEVSHVGDEKIMKKKKLVQTLSSKKKEMPQIDEFFVNILKNNIAESYSVRIQMFLYKFIEYN